MPIYKSSVWRASVNTTLNAMCDMDDLDGASIMVTGASGLVCSPIVDLIALRNDMFGGDTKLFLAGRCPEKMEQRFGPLMNKDYVEFVSYDAAVSKNELACAPDYIIHGASNAAPDSIMAEPIETMLSNFIGLKQLLDLGRAHGTRRLLFISSSEIYGKKESSEPLREGEYGYIDQLDARNSYSIGKRAAETLCASYGSEYGTDFVIVRPGHVYGPTASPQDSRVGSAWAWAAARREDIVMKSDGLQLRSYVHCLDCASAMLTVLLLGKSGHAYNISNPDSVVTIHEIGELYAEAGCVRLLHEEAANSEKAAFNPMRNSSLNATELLALGWNGLYNAQTGTAHTVATLRQLIA